MISSKYILNSPVCWNSICYWRFCGNKLSINQSIKLYLSRVALDSVDIDKLEALKSIANHLRWLERKPMHTIYVNGNNFHGALPPRYSSSQTIRKMVPWFLLVRWLEWFVTQIINALKPTQCSRRLRLILYCQVYVKQHWNFLLNRPVTHLTIFCKCSC